MQTAPQRRLVWMRSWPVLVQMLESARLVWTPSRLVLAQVLQTVTRRAAAALGLMSKET